MTGAGLSTSIVEPARASATRPRVERGQCEVACGDKICGRNYGGQLGRADIGRGTRTSVNRAIVTGMNPLPEIVIVVLAEPARTIELLRPAIAGTGLSTSKLEVGDVEPPVSESVTATLR